MGRIADWLVGFMCVVALVCLAIAGYVLWAWPAPTYDPLGGWSTPGWLIASGFTGYGLGLLVLASLQSAVFWMTSWRLRRAPLYAGDQVWIVVIEAGNED
jgi:hypothetical protein